MWDGWRILHDTVRSVGIMQGVGPAHEPERYEVVRRPRENHLQIPLKLRFEQANPKTPLSSEKSGSRFEHAPEKSRSYCRRLRRAVFGSFFDILRRNLCRWSVRYDSAIQPQFSFEVFPENESDFRCRLSPHLDWRTGSRQRRLGGFAR